MLERHHVSYSAVKRLFVKTPVVSAIGTNSNVVLDSGSGAHVVGSDLLTKFKPSERSLYSFDDKEVVSIGEGTFSVMSRDNQGFGPLQGYVMEAGMSETLLSLGKLHAKGFTIHLGHNGDEDLFMTTKSGTRIVLEFKDDRLTLPDAKVTQKQPAQPGKTKRKGGIATSSVRTVRARKDNSVRVVWKQSPNGGTKSLITQHEYNRQLVARCKADLPTARLLAFGPTSSCLRCFVTSCSSSRAGSSLSSSH